MDDGVFADWVAKIGLLSPVQRGRTYHGLALAEAYDCLDCPDVVIPATSVPEEVKAAILGPLVSAPTSRPLLSKIGQDRIANFGCPHCGGDGVHRWGKANGKPRYRCASGG